MDILNDESHSGGFDVTVDSLPEWRNDVVSIIIKDKTTININKSDSLSQMAGIDDEDWEYLGRIIGSKIKRERMENDYKCDCFEEIVRLGIFNAKPNEPTKFDGFSETRCIPNDLALEIKKACIDFLQSSNKERLLV